MRKVKIHRMVVKVLDFEGYGPDEVAMSLESNRYFCVRVMGRDMNESEWDDSHPCNQMSMTLDDFDKWMLENSRQSSNQASASHG